MATVKFPKQDIYPKGKWTSHWSDDVTVKSDILVDQTRWSVVHEVVFEYKGKHYLTHYSEGATEYQDESPFEYDDFIECEEVEQREVTVLQWVKI